MSGLYWEHGPECWQRYAVDVWGDIAFTPKDEEPYCAMTFGERLADDPKAEPSNCGGRWVRFMEESDE